MKVLLAIWLCISAVAAPPLFRAQNQTATPATNVLDGFTHYWLADDIAGVDGDPVGTWPDGIASNNATAAGSERPALRTADINGKNSVEFDGVNDGFDLTTQIDVSSGFTVCTVSYRASQPNNWFTLTEYDSPYTPYAAFWYLDGNVYLHNNSTAYSVASTATGWSVISATSSPAVEVDGSPLSLSLSGVGAGSGYMDAIGKRGLGEFTVGKHAFIGIKTGTPDPAFIAAFEAWAASYYGLP